MSMEPTYLGSDIFEPNDVKGVHTFFQKHEVAKWTVTSFLSEYPSDLKEFSKSLDLIALVKSVGRPIRTYCHKTMEFLDSVEGQTHVRILQAKSRTSQNSTLIKENTFEAFQQDVIDDQTASREARHAKRARQDNANDAGVITWKDFDLRRLPKTTVTLPGPLKNTRLNHGKLAWGGPHRATTTRTMGAKKSEDKESPLFMQYPIGDGCHVVLAMYVEKDAQTALRRFPGIERTRLESGSRDKSLDEVATMFKDSLEDEKKKALG
ncbi:hypothetical protein BGX27_003253 [Mortierella sp. AM989]|nr:hypothetical protein BGX27_003253 [Mortierella sp. AM989]